MGTTNTYSEDSWKNAISIDMCYPKETTYQAKQVNIQGVHSGVLHLESDGVVEQICLCFTDLHIGL